MSMDKAYESFKILNKMLYENGMEEISRKEYQERYRKVLTNKQEKLGFFMAKARMCKDLHDNGVSFVTNLAIRKNNTLLEVLPLLDMDKMVMWTFKSTKPKIKNIEVRRIVLVDSRWSLTEIYKS